MKSTSLSTGLDLYHAEPKRSVMVDDNLARGILPAKKIGMVTVLYGEPGGTLPEGVDYQICSLLDLKSLF